MYEDRSEISTINDAVEALETPLAQSIEVTEPSTTVVAAPQAQSVEVTAPTSVEEIDAASEQELPAETAPTPVEEDDATAIARLSKLSTMDYDRVRKEEAAKMGVSVKILDDAVSKARRKGEGDGNHLPFCVAEPYPEPINPAQLLTDICTYCLKFIVVSMSEAIAITLWITFTWFIGFVQVAPLLLINAPEPSCGKTQAFDFVARLSARAMASANSSMAYLFRSIELWQPTILIDEADTFIKENHEMKGVINAGYLRASAFIGRVVGDNHEPKQFNVWGAKALAGITLDRHLPESTMSRGLVINLRRKMAHETVSLIRHEPAANFDLLASKLARFAEDYSEQVEAARPELPDGLNDRSKDNWEPLLAIAGCAGAEWVEQAVAAAIELSKASELHHVSISNELLSDIQYIFCSKGIDKISSAELVKELVRDDESVWTTFSRGKEITPRGVAGQLEKYGIQPRTVRLNKHSTPKGYYAADFKDAFARYLPPSDIAVIDEFPDDDITELVG